MCRSVHFAIVSILALATASFASGCAADTTSAPGESVPASDDAANANAPITITPADSAQIQRAKGAPGSACTTAEDCTGFVCPSCESYAKYCTGAHVCATEAETCSAVTCDGPDAN